MLCQFHKKILGQNIHCTGEKPSFIRACNEGPQNAHKLKIEEFGSFLFVFISEPALVHIECWIYRKPLHIMNWLSL